MIIIPGTIFNIILLIYNTISIIFFNTTYGIFKNMFSIYILNGIIGLLLIDIKKDKINKILQKKTFNIIDYLPLNKTNTIIISYLNHISLITTPIIIIYIKSIDLNELISYYQLFKSMNILLIIIYIYKLYIYPNTIKELYLL